MIDDQFAEFCAEHPDLFFEVTAEGELIATLPKRTLTSIQKQEIARQFTAWAVQDARGIAGHSSGGFVLPNGARRSPNLSWTPLEDVARLTKTELETYWHLCPAFVIELHSHSDRLRISRAKMQEWVSNGARLAWLIDPETNTVEIYRQTRDPEVIAGTDLIVGEGPVEGFVLHLSRVWNPIGH